MYTLQDIIQDIRNLENFPELELDMDSPNSLFIRKDLQSQISYTSVYVTSANGDEDVINKRVYDFVKRHMFAGITEDLSTLFNGETRLAAFFTSKDPDFMEKEGAMMTLHGVYGEEFLKKGFEDVGLLNPEFKFVTLITGDIYGPVMTYRTNTDVRLKGHHPAPRTIQ